MVKKKELRRDFHMYLRKHYAGKYVAYLKMEDKILAVGKTFAEVEKKLEKQKVNFDNVVFSGPVQEYGRTYVYLLPIREKAN